MICDWLGSATTGLRWAYGAAFLVFVGVVGESVADLTSWIKDESRRKRIEKASALILILGLAGDLVSVRIGQIEIRDLTRLAGDAKTSAESAENTAGSSVTLSKDAARIADGAKDVAKEARTQADSIKKDVSSAEKRLARIHEFLTPRSLTQKEMDDLREALKPLADPHVPILVVGSMESGLNIQVWRSLKDAGFEKAEVKDINEPVPYGMGVSSPLKHAYLAGKISSILLKAGIGPMVGGLGIIADTEPIEIFIGDIRTAPLPSLK
jgi:hypothetical protein